MVYFPSVNIKSTKQREISEYFVKAGTTSPFQTSKQSIKWFIVGTHKNAFLSINNYYVEAQPIAYKKHSIAATLGLCDQLCDQLNVCVY